ncbi:MAG: RNA-binding protein [Candidatus Thiodiazotropha sp. (ex Dulcina madagascariensis)]|nr:RNA-binding protein [Candidatus Thiodiazotropha sp. (ex Epidulcina cf. delphinae)]MCU7936712.1 RNA-binding protein [Candidatus Thiodiazotropha sp. (ex Dulcina madagascariensis)]
MWIFFKHLPPDISTKEIRRVTLKGARPGRLFFQFFNKTQIKRSQIIRIKDPGADRLEYHAIVQVESASAADAIIENLDGKTVNGLFLKPHRYHRRVHHRNRRIRQASLGGDQDRRIKDRRRSNLVKRVLEIINWTPQT